MNLTIKRCDHLTVVDQRSRFTAVAVGWRTGPEAHTAGASRLRQAVSSAAEVTSTGLEPVSIDWTVSDGAHCLTAMLPEAISSSWTEAVIVESHEIAGDPVLAVVGPRNALHDVKGTMARFEGGSSAAQHEAVPSTMSQSTVQGFEKTIITGQDPSQEVGRAATFLAICLIAGGPGTLLFDAVRGPSRNAVLQASRGLQDGRPTVTWQLIAPGHRGVAVLEAALTKASEYRLTEHPAAVAQARQFARGNLNRAWRSPIELARSLAQYEVMGWGGELIRDPDASLGHVDTKAIEHAVEGLMRPIKEVLGRT